MDSETRVKDNTQDAALLVLDQELLEYAFCLGRRMEIVWVNFTTGQIGIKWL